MIHSSPTENRVFFSQMAGSQQEVHSMGCKDSGKRLGQRWVRPVEFASLKAPLLELSVVETLWKREISSHTNLNLTILCKTM